MQKVTIIAEVGVNHNGSMDLAKIMIDKAAEAGMDAVKFQAGPPSVDYQKRPQSGLSGSQHWEPAGNHAGDD